MKKLLSLILACTLLIVFSFGVFAEDSDGGNEYVSEAVDDNNAEDGEPAVTANEPEDCDECENDIQFCVCEPAPPEGCEDCGECEDCLVDEDCADCEENPCECEFCLYCGVYPCECSDIIAPDEPEELEGDPEPIRSAPFVPPPPLENSDLSFDDSHRITETSQARLEPEPEPEPEPEEEIEEIIPLAMNEIYDNPGGPSGGGSGVLPLIIMLSLLIAGAGTAAPFVFKYYRQKMIYRY
ncbi:MAG: hypothetical protein FWD48_04755 [Oscillospiraceae bacterium]|nr:hypothetical protein [Oscillospiraceae bacterium]